MHRGYIKLWRKIQDWEWYDDLSLVGFFVHLVLKANYKDSKYHGVDIPRGSLVFGRRTTAKQFKLSERCVRTMLTRLKSTNEVAIKTTHQFSVICIVNYEKFQSETTHQTTHELTSDRPTSDPRVTTSKKGKKDKNENKTTYSKEFDQFWSIYPRKEGKGFACSSFGKLSLGDGLLNKIIAAVEIQKKSDQWTKDGGQYIPMPATWLNQRRWEDEGIQVQSRKKVGPRFIGIPAEMYGKI